MQKPQRNKRSNRQHNCKRRLLNIQTKLKHNQKPRMAAAAPLAFTVQRKHAFLAQMRLKQSLHRLRKQLRRSRKIQRRTRFNEH